MHRPSVFPPNRLGEGCFWPAGRVRQIHFLACLGLPPDGRPRQTDGDAGGALKLIQRTWGQMLATGPGTVWEKMAFDGMPANYAPLQAPARGICVTP